MGESIVQRLALEGATVRWWRSGREALKDTKSSALDAIVCDIRLPDLSGEDVFRQAALASKLPPFLFITGPLRRRQSGCRSSRHNSRHNPMKVSPQASFVLRAAIFTRKPNLSFFSAGPFSPP
jgi:CheY-like chemotaxis protein